MKTILILQLLVCTLCAEVRDFPDPYPEIYNSFHVMPLNLHGWSVHSEAIKEILARKKIQTVVEVGVWTGNFTVSTARMLDKGSVYYAVDHWKGSIEHHNDKNWSKLLPTLYQQFLSNMIHCNLTDKVIPVRMESLKAAAKFHQLGIKADLIYLDAAHDYQSVLNDIQAWYPLLSDEGILCGDDWTYGNGSVSSAVIDFAKAHGLQIHHAGEFWSYSK